MLFLNSILYPCILLAGHACPLYVVATISMIETHVSSARVLTNEVAGSDLANIG